MIGDDGGVQWGALLSYNFALSLLIVTTNVVVLYEYLSQECPLWGTIKDYCVDYEIHLLVSFPLRKIHNHQLYY